MTELNKGAIQGAGGCFRAGAQVQLVGGKTVAIESLKAGDVILSFDEAGDIQHGTVTKLHVHEDPQPILRVRFWRGETHITGNHWVLNQYASFVEMGSLTDEDALVDGMGHLRPIISMEHVADEPVYNLTVTPHHTFICDGIRVHNGGHRARHPEVKGAGGGGKGGGGSARAAVEVADNIQSRAIVDIIDMLGEGQIGGLVDGAKSIFLDGTPLKNADGTDNFKGYQFTQRLGTQHQDPVPGFAEVESAFLVNVRVRRANPITITVNNPNASRIACSAAIPSLRSQSTTTGDVNATVVEWQYEVSTNGGPFQLAKKERLNNKTNSRVEIQSVFDLPRYATNGQVATSWAVRMVRLTADATTSALQNETHFSGYTEIVDAKLSYPNTAYIAMSINSEYFNAIPDRAYLVDGLYIQVPSNYDPVTRQYSGVWDGTFKVAISNNPAWVIYDIVKTERYGLGQYLQGIGIDTGKLYQIGRYCDEMVPDGFGGMEPRFAINTEIQTREDAIKVVNDMASAFRGMIYWMGDRVGFTQDSPGAVQMRFVPANVVDGNFVRSGSDSASRHSVVHVVWNDPKQHYRREIEYVEDAELVERFGIRVVEITAFGCTSRGQAHRLGKWLLYTEKYESNMITFRVGMDSALLLPDDLIEIHNPNWAGEPKGGRAAASTLTSVTFDRKIKVNAPGAKLAVRMPDGSWAERYIVENSGEYGAVSWVTPLPDMPLPGAIWMLSEAAVRPVLARVLGVKETDDVGVLEIVCVEHHPDKYAAVERDLKIQPPNISIIDPRVVKMPTDFKVVEAPIVVAPSVVGLSLELSWQSDAAYYEVQWRRLGRYATNWVSATTTSPMFDIENVRSGAHEINIVAVSHFGRKSLPFTATYTTVGRTAAPGDVANFKVSKRSEDLLITWDDVTDINLKGYEVRVGQSWDEGEVVTTAFRGTMITHDQSEAGTYFYHIRSINDEDTYSDNVSTFELVLNAPAPVEGFDLIQSDKRLEFVWKLNPEPDIAYYELREGPSWTNGTLVSQVQATTFSIPSGSIGVRRFWIKSVAAPGIYADTAAFIDGTIAMPANSNIVFTTEEAAMGWPGHKINMREVGYDLMMTDGVARSEYIFNIDLLDSYRAQNSIYASLNSIVHDTDEMTWDTSLFTWDSVEALRHWAPGGEIDSVTGRYQIAAKTGLRNGEIEGWRLNESLNSVGGKAPYTVESPTYEEGRYARGLQLSGARVGWSDVAIPSEFAFTVWLRPKGEMGNTAQRVLQLRNSTTGAALNLSYNGARHVFVLASHRGDVIEVPITYAPDDMLALAISQSKTERSIYVSHVDGAPASAKKEAAPIGPFDQLNLFWA